MAFMGILCAVLVGLGLYAARFTTSGTEFFTAGRNVGVFLIISTQLATWVGGSMTIGWVGSGYRYGIGGLWYGALMCSGLIFLALVGRPLREKEYTSLADWFDEIYGGNKVVRVLTSLYCMVAPISWVSAQFTAGARMLESIAGFPYVWGVLLLGFVVILYSSFGGLRAVVYTDCFQWWALFVLFLCIAPSAIVQAVSAGGIFKLTPPEMHNLFAPKGTPPYAPILWLFSGFVVACGIEGTFQRIFAAKDWKAASAGLWSTAIVDILWATFTAVVGLSIFALNPALKNPDQAMPWFISNRIVGWVGTAYLATVILATTSTGDSMLNTITMDLVHGIYRPLVNPNISEQQFLRIARTVTIVIGVLSVYWSTSGAWMLTVLGLGYTVGAGPLAGVLLVSWFAKGARNANALAISLLCGSAMGVITQFNPALKKIPAGGTVFSLGVATVLCLILGYMFNAGKPAADPVGGRSSSGASGDGGRKVSMTKMVLQAFGFPSR
jgi:SSS family solute:Na+ symporter